MKRTEQRESIFLLLYQKDFHTAEELDAQIDMHFDSISEGIKVKDSDRKYITDKLKKIIENSEEIDKKIDEATEGWTLKRIGKVELAILRLAYYEIVNDEEVPDKVAIDEAVKIKKKYGSDDSYKFVNGVLAKITSKNLDIKDN